MERPSERTVHFLERLMWNHCVSLQGKTKQNKTKRVLCANGPLRGAASADRGVIFPGMCSAWCLCSLCSAQSQAEREAEHFKEKAKTDDSAVLPHRHSTILCSKLSLVRHIFQMVLCLQRLSVFGEFACVGKITAGCRIFPEEARFLCVSRASVSLAFWKVPEPAKVTKKY